MKKILLLSAIAFATFSSNAQFKTVELGILGGINIHNVAEIADRSDNHYNTYSATGPSVGCYVKFKIGNKLNFKVMPTYDQNGWVDREVYLPDNLGNSQKADVFTKLNYLNIPLVLETSSGSKVKIVGDAGFFLGYLLSKEIITKYSSPTLGTISSSSDSGKRFNFGASVGIGTSIPLGSSLNFLLGMRANLGFININETPGYEIRTIAISFSTGVSFNLRKPIKGQ